MKGAALRRPRASSVLVTLAMLAACGGSADKPPAVSVQGSRPAALRGTLLAPDSTTLVFVACGTTDERPLELRPYSRVMEALVTLNGSVRDSIFLEVDADTTGGRIRAREARFAARFTERPADWSYCDRPRPAFAVEAVGTDPFWRVTLDSTLLVLERADAPLEVAFVADTPVVRGDVATVMAHGEGGREQTLQLDLRRTACRDTMSGSWYPLRADVQVGKSVLHGCARR